MSFKKIFLKVMLTLVAVISFSAGTLASDAEAPDCVFDESLLIREKSRFTSRDPKVFVVNDSIQRGNHPLMWEALKILNDLMDKYPNVTSAIRWLKRYHGDKLGKTFEVTLEHMVRTPADKYWTVACVRGNFDAIVLNDIFWGQGFEETITNHSFLADCGWGKTFHDCCEESFLNKAWSYCKKGDYIKHIISHEFGHVVEMVFACLVKYDNSRSEYAEYYGKPYDKICDLVRRHILYDGGTKWHNDTASDSGGYFIPTGYNHIITFDTFCTIQIPEGENATITTQEDSCEHLYTIAHIYNNNISGAAKKNTYEFFAEMFSYAQCNELGKLSWADANPYLAKAIHDFINSSIMPAIPDEHTTVVRGVISVWHWLTSWF